MGDIENGEVRVWKAVLGSLVLPSNQMSRNLLRCMYSANSKKKRHWNSMIIN